MMDKRPKCKGCGKPAYLIVGRFAYCGECALKIQEMKQKEDEAKIAELLKC